MIEGVCLCALVTMLELKLVYHLKSLDMDSLHIENEKLIQIQGEFPGLIIWCHSQI